MKKIMLTLLATMALAIQASAMSYSQAREEALFLTDKMAYELNLTDAQYEAAYEINLDYLMSIGSQHDVFSSYWERRNADLRYVLYSWQWDAFCAATYFYRPLYWDAGRWHFRVYLRYPHRDHLYFGRPHVYATYHGGHGMHHYRHHSYYADRHHHYRPAPSRDHHAGMRNNWNHDRQSISRSHDHSSTRITGQRNSDHSFSNQGHNNSHSHASAPVARSSSRSMNSISRSSSSMTRSSSGNSSSRRSVSRSSSGSRSAGRI